MSKYDELRAHYADWEDRFLNNQSQAWQFVYDLANGFSDYLGATKVYRDYDGSMKRRIRPCYVSVDDDGGVHYHEPSDNRNIIERDTDGYWISGITTVLDRNEDASLKRPFTFAIKFLLNKNSGTIYIANIRDDNIDFSLENPDFTPIYERMLSFFEKIFKAEPWDIRGDEKVDFEIPKNPIGFQSS